MSPDLHTIKETMRYLNIHKLTLDGGEQSEFLMLDTTGEFTYRYKTKANKTQDIVDMQLMRSILDFNRVFDVLMHIMKRRELPFVDRRNALKRAARKYRFESGDM